jgi:MFS family permease
VTDSVSPSQAVPQAETVAARPAGLGRDFTQLLSATLISTLGDGALVAALPLFAQSLTTNPVQISGVATAATLPWLLLSVIGGAIADRFDRRRLMMGAQCVQAALVGAVALIATLHLTQLWMLYVLAFGLGAAAIIFQNSSQAAVPALVHRDGLDSANGRLGAAMQVSQSFAGPPLGAALFAFAIPAPFWLNTATFVLSVLLLSRIRAKTRPERQGPRTALFTDVKEGLKWLGSHRLPLSLTLIAGAGNFCEQMALGTLVLFAHSILHLGNRGYGVLLAAMAIGGVLGSLVAPRLVQRFGGLRIAVFTQIVGPLVWLAIGLVGRTAVTVVVLFTFFSIVLSLWNVVASSTRQRVVPGELLGRVTGAGRMAAYGALPLGSLAGGFLARSYGLIAPWIVGSLLNMLVVAFAVPVLLRSWDQSRQP